MKWHTVYWYTKNNCSPFDQSEAYSLKDSFLAPFLFASIFKGTSWDERNPEIGPVDPISPLGVTVPLHKGVSPGSTVDHGRKLLDKEK